MAYDPTNPPSLVGQGVGGTEGMRFFSFVWIDPIGTVIGDGYITNAVDLGMRPGDSVVYKDAAGVGEWMENHLVVMEIDDDTGAGTLGFPDIPLEALPEADTFDPGDMTQFLVLYQNGRQTRIQIGQFTPNAATIASQAEAEAGTDNEKRMTPLRTAQAIAARLINAALTGNPTAPTAAPGDNDTTIATTAFVQAAINLLKGGVGAAYDTLAEIGTAIDGLLDSVADRVGYSAQSKTAAEQAQARKNIGLENGYPLLHVVDEKPTNTNGGTSVAGVWQTRTLNTVRVNDIAGASLVSNQIELPAGTYEIEASAPAYRPTGHKSRLRNITDGVTVVVGGAAYGAPADDGASHCFMFQRFTLAATKTLEFQHYIVSAVANTGLGTSVAAGEVEIYADVRIRRIK